MRLIDTELVEEIIRDLPTVITIMAVSVSVMLGVILGVYVTHKSIEILVESLFL